MSGQHEVEPLTQVRAQNYFLTIYLFADIFYRNLLYN